MSNSAFYLALQRGVVVCPDCGQVYDPAKAALLPRPRVFTSRGDVRTVKPQRVAAQDVQTAAHRAGRHHQAHLTATQLALRGWAPLALDYARSPVYDDAQIAGIDTLEKIIDAATRIGFARTEELPSLAIDLEPPQREFVERVVRAAQAVRVDHPWWRAYLHELGADAEEIACGIVVNTANRGDLFFAHTRRAVSTHSNPPTLRGLT